ncbi:MAG: dodecin family protein [Gemmatimonadota bacterium]|jgi:hypothetical protein|nr:dodecin family protein [Gemmatimonadota bacterium]
MSVVKVTELIAESNESFEAAVREAVREASKTIRGIKSVWVKDMQAKVENGELRSFRVNVKVSFVVEGPR